MHDLSNGEVLSLSYVSRDLSNGEVFSRSALLHWRRERDHLSIGEVARSAGEGENSTSPLERSCIARERAKRKDR